MSDSRVLQTVTQREAPRPLAQRPAAPLGVPLRPQVTSDDGVQLTIIWQAFSRWWRVIVPATLLIAGIGIAMSFRLFVPQYRAMALLRIDETPKYVVASKPEDDSRRFVFTQVELLRSPLVLSKALEDPQVARMPELAHRKSPWLWLAEKKLEVAPVNNSELLMVAYEGPDPVASARLVDSIVTSYLNYLDSEQEEQDNLLVQALEEEQREQQEKLKQMEDEIRQLRKQIPGDPLAIPHRQEIVIADSPLKEIQRQLNEAEVGLIQLDAQIRATEELVRKPSMTWGDSLVDAQIDQDPVVTALKFEIEQLHTKLDEIARYSRLGEKDPQYQAVRNSIQQGQVRLQEKRLEVRPRIEQQISATSRQRYEIELVDMRRQRDAEAARIDRLRERLSEQRQTLDASSAASLDLEFALQRLEPAQDVYAQITQRLTTMRTERGRPARVRLSQAARASEVPVQPLPMTGLLISTALALGLPFGLAVLWEVNVRRITSVDQLQQKMDFGVVGEVAQLPARSGSLVPGDDRNKLNEVGVFEESIDSLRTGLVLADRDAEVQVLAVVSAISGEGKTSIASQLAVSLARSSGKPTLLIDGDMRSPDMHNIFQLPRTPGLAEVLQGKCRLDDAINRSWSDAVHILPAGDLHCNPHKLLGAGSFRDLLDEARLWYRYIVIDTPPILSASESLVMARDADGALMCTMRDVSRESYLRTAYQRLLQTGARPVGKVLNGVPLKQYAYRYGTYDYARTP